MVGGEALDVEAYRALFSHSPDGVLFTEPETGRILAVNPAACRMLGWSEDELRRRGRHGIADPDDGARWAAALRARDETGTFRGELSVVRRDESCFPAEVTAGLFTDASGAARNCFVVRDVTEQKAAEEIQRRSEVRFRTLLDTSIEAFIAMDADGLIREWNHQAEVIFGWSRDEVLGRRLADTIIPAEYREGHAEGLTRYLDSGEGAVLGQRLELEGLRRDGVEFPVELTIWAVESGGEVSFNALLHDVSERRQREHELWELALVDDLTGLHNRRSFVLLAEHAIKEAARAQRPVIAVFADVDGLKAINDAYGHAEGDGVLRVVAQALTRACRLSDIVGRLGGDEFVILLAETHGAAGLEDRIRGHLAELTRPSTYPVSLSIGVARCEATQECRLDQLLERADDVMYREKAERRAAHTNGRPEDVG